MVTALALLLAAPPPFELKTGDRVVWLGGTVVEREQRYGYWETALHAAFPKADFTVRNLGWSGDTVWGESRAGFDDAKKGFERLVTLTNELKPTVLFVQYGGNEAFAGEAGLPAFVKQYEKLLDAVTVSKPRVVLITPLPFEYGPAAAQNDNVAKYASAVKQIAEKRGAMAAEIKISVGPPLTNNGMHFTPRGYEASSLGLLPALGVTLSESYTSYPEALRQAVVAKNQLFFYRWRPQNETYLFGFRKHEQGRNAVEVAAFDSLVAEAEKAIAKLK